MKSAEDFKRQAEVKGITFWESHKCSVCGVPVGTEIQNGEAFYRSSCDCGWNPNHSHGWEHVAERYNRQTNKDVIKKMNEFWGFEDQ
jgi:hypothetical protein